MTSRSTRTYRERAEASSNTLVRKLFELAERKKSNVVVSADLTTTDELLATADNIVSDFGSHTVEGLKELAEKHDFLFFEDRKFVDIGNTVQMQYHGGALKISDWAHIVNASVLAGPGIVQALSTTVNASDFPYAGERGLPILAEMTTKGSLAVGDYTKASVAIARQSKDFVIGFVAMQALTDIASELGTEPDEDFVVFTTGVNQSTAGDTLGQQYQTPEQAVRKGADFIISGRGIYAAADPLAAVKAYRQEGREAYETRIRR